MILSKRVSNSRLITIDERSLFFSSAALYILRLVLSQLGRSSHLVKLHVLTKTTHHAPRKYHLPQHIHAQVSSNLLPTLAALLLPCSNHHPPRGINMDLRPALARNAHRVPRHHLWLSARHAKRQDKSLHGRRWDHYSAGECEA